MVLSMAKIISAPTVVPAAGEPPKIIEEFVGRVNSGTAAISIAKMTSPSGWRERGQTPEFDEFTVVLRGQLQIETRYAVHQVSAGQAIVVNAGEWVRYSTPGADGAEYIAVCLPAFAPETVHRDRD
jgi:mannose-6-phosphate isomerase-like protein (cupin superfamily)